MPSDLPKLYLARHGDTAWTDSHQHTGRCKKGDGTPGAKIPSIH